MAPDYCSENLEYSTHIADEIHRNSSPENFSCELYERAIRSHKQQKNNAKGLEKAYVERENISPFPASIPTEEWTSLQI